MKLHLLGLFCVVLMLSACSALKITYNNAPGLVGWWLDDYLDFTAEQQEILRPQLDKLHAWHRQHELPEYVALLEQMQAMAPNDVAAEDACLVLSAMFTRIEALNTQFEPMVAALAPGLSAEQISHLQQQLEESNEEWREEWMDGSDEERKGYRVKQAIKRAEMFYGDLEAGQVDIIRARTAVSSFDPETSYAERLRRQQDAVQTLSQLRQGLPAGQANTEIHQFFLRMADSPNPAYRKYLAIVIAESCATTAALHNSTTAEQRALAVEKLRDYAADLRLLAKQGDSTP